MSETTRSGTLTVVSSLADELSPAGWPRPWLLWMPPGDGVRSLLMPQVLPVPWVNCGLPYQGDWVTLDEARAAQAQEQRLCAVCGQPLDRVTLLGRGGDHSTPAPGCHPRCMQLTLGACAYDPYLDGYGPYDPSGGPAYGDPAHDGYPPHGGKPADYAPPHDQGPHDPPGDPDEGRQPDASACGADRHQWLVGRDRSEIPPAPAGAIWRVYPSEAPVTMDYNPRRMNVVWNERTRRVTSVRCG